MGETFDLNALRRPVVGTEKPLGKTAATLAESLERNRRMNEGTVSERIAAFEAEIMRLEVESNQPTPLARFNTLSSEEQQAEMARELTGVVPEAEWDINIFRSGLEAVSKKNPADLRLAVAKSKLDLLRAEASDV